MARASITSRQEDDRIIVVLDSLYIAEACLCRLAQIKFVQLESIGISARRLTFEVSIIETASKDAGFYFTTHCICIHLNT